MSGWRRFEELYWVWIIPVAIVLCGGALLLSASGREQREALIAASPVETTAIVLKVDDGISLRSGVHTYTPTVEFALRNGDLFQVELDSEPDEQAFTVGHGVPVTYRAQDPSAVVVTERMHDYLVTRVWGWVALTIGIIAAAGAAWVTRAVVRMRRRKR